MPSISLMLDFKFDEQGHLRVLDLGDGLAAQSDGFPETLTSTILNDWYEMSGAGAVVSALGELPKELMQPETLHIPLMPRRTPVGDSLTHTHDLLQVEASLLPYSSCYRSTAYQSYVWNKNGSKNITRIPLSLIACEVHKILWYTLMDSYLPLEIRQTILYWSNDQLPQTVDLSTLNLVNGVFIKIGDRSSGKAEEVYYAKDRPKIQEVLMRLYHIYQQKKEKHIFIIEPAYVTIKDGYNATGRAFVTLSLDRDSHTLCVKIAGAKWMCPKARPTEARLEEEILVNAKHGLRTLELDETELSKLSSDLVHLYGDVFRAAFEHDDLMSVCKTHPIMPSFEACLRVYADYSLLLGAYRDDRRCLASPEKVTTGLFVTYMQRDHLSHVNALLSIEFDSKPTDFFRPASPRVEKKYLQNVLNHLCDLLLLERYIAFLKVRNGGLWAKHAVFGEIVSKERRIQAKINAWLVNYLRNKDEKYDTKDFSRALRQACVLSDLAVIKLLVHSGRADVNGCSPKTKQTPLDFANHSAADSKSKAQMLAILQYAGAKTAKELAVAETPTLLVSYQS